MANHSKQLQATMGAAAPAVAADQGVRTPWAAPRRVWGWLDDRLGLSALRYNVPPHANTFWYTLGGITFVGILVLVATGIWLAQYYNPDPATPAPARFDKEFTMVRSAWKTTSMVGRSAPRAWAA